MIWNPSQYLKFSSERFAPFDDLVKLIDLNAIVGASEARSLTPEARRSTVVDLGCGSGELTLKLAGMLPGASVLGIDNSREMLVKAKANAVADANVDVHFELMSIEEFVVRTGGNTNPPEQFDLIFSNAAIHWVEDHPQLLERLWERLKSGGQIVVQIPSGVRNRAQMAVKEIAEQEPYLSALKDWRWNFPVLPFDEYAEILYRLGATKIEAFEKVYPHVLKNGAAAYDWVAGTTMTAYTKRLPESLIEPFKADVKAEVVNRYQGSPVLFPFRRIFFCGRKSNVTNFVTK